MKEELLVFFRNKKQSRAENSSKDFDHGGFWLYDILGTWNKTGLLAVRYNLTGLWWPFSGLIGELHCLLLVFEVVGIGHQWFYSDFLQHSKENSQKIWFELIYPVVIKKESFPFLPKKLCISTAIFVIIILCSFLTIIQFLLESTLFKGGFQLPQIVE